MLELKLLILVLGAGLTGLITAYLGNRTTVVPQLGKRHSLLLGLLGFFAGALLLLIQAVSESGNPLLLLASAICLGVLAGATITDLREKFIDIGPILIATGLTALLGIATGYIGSMIAGAATSFILAGLYWGGGWLFARVRGAGIDPLTGERVEDVGTGDVFIWLLGGVWLGVLAGPLPTSNHTVVVAIFIGIVFFIQLFLSAFVSFFALLWAHRTKHEGDLHLPLVPSITVTLIGAAVWLTLQGSFLITP